MDKFVLSNLGHTWIIDLDGTIVKHNGYKTDGKDSLLPGVKEFFETMAEEDMVILLTSRSTEYSIETEQFLSDNNIRYDHIIYNAPFGERVLINDDKPSGLQMAYAKSVPRDGGFQFSVVIDETK